MAKNVTMSDIARELGISKNSVSLALRGKAGVSDDLREQIIAKANELQYDKSDKPYGIVLALIPYRLACLSEGMYYQCVCFEMEAYAKQRGCQLIISSVSDEDEKQVRSPMILNTIPCSGIITIGDFSEEYCRMISRLGIRYVTLGAHYDGLIVSCISTANISGAYILTEELIKRGHKKIQFFGYRNRTVSLNERWIGYQRAMQKYHLPVVDNSYSQRSADTDQDYIDGEFGAICQALDLLDELPTAYVCGHDYTAYHVINALAKRGLKNPDDYSIVGFDDIQQVPIQALNLTTYDTPKADIARASLDLLLDSDNSVCKHVQLYGKLILRDSIRPVLG